MNGLPKCFFKGSKGLRQGGPLSSYLFIMVADSLGRLVAKVEVVGLIEGFLAVDGCPATPFIQFVDDSLFLLKADGESLQNLRCILLVMEAAMGFKVNWSKSILSPVGNVPGIAELADVIGCEVLPLPISYLGFALGVKASSKAIWNPVLAKMGSKLAHWKGNCLSFRGKACFVEECSC